MITRTTIAVLTFALAASLPACGDDDVETTTVGVPGTCEQDVAEPSTTQPTSTTTSTTTTTTVPPATTTTLAADDDGDGVVRVQLWGDSLAFEARDTFLVTMGRHPEIHAETETCGGTAVCDYLADYAGHADEVEVAVLLFSGNAEWSCMLEPRADLPADADPVTRYEADLTDAIASLRAGGAEVLIIGSPWAAWDEPDGMRRRLMAMYADVAARTEGVTFVDAGAAVLADGAFTWTLPCLSFEDGSLGCDLDGRIPVRSPDGLHLCPNDHPPDPLLGRCDVWSSGAYRFGTAISEATLDLAGVEG